LNELLYIEIERKIIQMKTMNRKYSSLAILLLISAASVLAGNQLMVVRTATNTLEVQLSNTDLVAGVQFSLHTSSDIVLGELERGIRNTDSQWAVASYKPNDSTINVVILNMKRNTFAAGQGTIAKIPFHSINPFDRSFVSLERVMVTNNNADSLGVMINTLEWSNRTLYTANDESKSFVLGQNFPNPFNPSTKIGYRLNKAAQVRLSIYDITGREVNRLVDQYQYVGEYTKEWNSQASSGEKLASGMYFARLTVDNESVSRKLVMTK
jgi:hypothetical protein